MYPRLHPREGNSMRTFRRISATVLSLRQVCALTAVLLAVNLAKPRNPDKAEVLPYPFPVGSADQAGQGDKDRGKEDKDDSDKKAAPCKKFKPRTVWQAFWLFRQRLHCPDCYLK